MWAWEGLIPLPPLNEKGYCIMEYPKYRVHSLSIIENDEEEYKLQKLVLREGKHLIKMTSGKFCKPDIFMNIDTDSKTFNFNIDFTHLNIDHPDGSTGVFTVR